MITLELDFVMADLLRSVLEQHITDMKWADSYDVIDFDRICEIRNNIDHQMRNNM